MSNWKTLESFEAELMQDAGFREVHEEQLPDYTVAREILAARLAMGLSQQALAKAIGTSQGRVSKWERAEEEPRIDTLRKIAEATGRVLVVGLFDEAVTSKGSGRPRPAARKTAVKKSTARRAGSARKSTSRKKAAGKSTVQKSAARKTAARKTSARKSTSARKASARKSGARKSAARKTGTKKVSAGRATARRGAGRR